MPRGVKNTPESFWFNVCITSPSKCWEWQGVRLPKGYGQTRFQSKMMLAHRLAFILTNGEIPDGLNVLHSCDNPPCCNPGHLRLGTTQNNADDMYIRGRGADRTGSRNPRAKLTESQVTEIREKYAAGNTTLTSLADEYGVANSLIHGIVSNTSWKHLL